MTMTNVALASRPHALYRFYGRAGVLLYIGLTMDPSGRWAAHSKDKPWWLDVHDIKIEHYPDRTSVELAERQAIVAERPVHNVTHNTRRLPALLSRLAIESVTGSDAAHLVITYRFNVDRHRKAFARRIRVEHETTAAGAPTHVQLDRDDYLQFRWNDRLPPETFPAAERCTRAGLKAITTAGHWAGRWVNLNANDQWISLYVPAAVAETAVRTLVAVEIDRDWRPLEDLTRRLEEGSVR